jgi:hypothetical protein
MSLTNQINNKKSGPRPTSGKFQDIKVNLGAPQSNYISPPSKQAGPPAPYCRPPRWGKRVSPADRLAACANRLAPGAGAGNGIRTRDTKLGKLVLYQLSYARSTLNNYI